MPNVRANRPRTKGRPPTAAPINVGDVLAGFIVREVVAAQDKAGNRRPILCGTCSCGQDATVRLANLRTAATHGRRFHCRDCRASLCWTMTDARTQRIKIPPEYAERVDAIVRRHVAACMAAGIEVHGHELERVLIEALQIAQIEKHTPEEEVVVSKYEPRRSYYQYGSPVDLGMM